MTLRTETPHPVSTVSHLWSMEYNADKGSRQIGRATLEDAMAPVNGRAEYVCFLACSLVQNVSVQHGTDAAMRNPTV
jgi:hypothetical protein